jgi:hypothetical protein
MTINHWPDQALSSKLARRPLTGTPTAKALPEKMRDYAVLANACKRAGKATVAAHLVFNRGVLFENMGEYGAALRCYKVRCLHIRPELVCLKMLVCMHIFPQSLMSCGCTPRVPPSIC